MQALVNRFDTREFRLILGGLLLLVVAGAVSYAVMPQWKKLTSARQSLTAVRTLPESGDVSEQLSGMTEMVEGLHHSIHGEAGALPARELEAYMIGKLQSISWSHTVELGSVRPGQRQRVSGFWETSFKVEVSGNYLSLFEWMDSMREQLGFVVIKEFQLAPLGAGDDEPRLQAAMTIASYQGT